MDGLPHLIYVSREKCPKYPHHYKAGALNVLVNNFLELVLFILCLVSNYFSLVVL